MEENSTDLKIKKPPIGYSAVVPLLFVIICWLIFWIGWEWDFSQVKWGVFPREISSLKGIFTYPFIHGSVEHLFNNSIPLLVLGWSLFYFYRDLAWKVIGWIWIMSGIWLWIAGRPAWHIGASGIIYGLAAFLFISGWLRREKRVAAVSLLVAFLYGGLWWGVLPVDPQKSWEGHLWGGIAGIAVALAYRKKGPQKPVYSWEEEENEITDGDFSLEDPSEIPGVTGNKTYPKPPPYLRIRYEYKPRDLSEKPENKGENQNDNPVRDNS